jgi:hypothetical protein
MSYDVDPKDLAQIKAGAAVEPKVGDVFRHYKGGLYVIVARSVMEDTLEPLVCYFSYAKQVYWTRTLANFTETVGEGDAAGPRFRREAP